jgi:hypothetical protein
LPRAEDPLVRIEEADGWAIEMVTTL